MFFSDIPRESPFAVGSVGRTDLCHLRHAGSTMVSGALPRTGGANGMQMGSAPLPPDPAGETSWFWQNLSSAEDGASFSSRAVRNAKHIQRVPGDCRCGAHV